MHEELIAAKVAAGLTREQAIEVIAAQEAEDARAGGKPERSKQTQATKQATKQAKPAEAGGKKEEPPQE